MNSKIYKQLNSKWASKPYPKKGSSFGGNGCGCCACTHVAIEQESKKNWTPENLRPWMINQGFAVYGQGTTWNGITETLKHIGHKKVVRVWSDPMSVAWKELNKGNRIGIILFGSGRAPNGTVWTAGGHYVAFTDYKLKNGKHYFYCKDSGGRNHDGWFTYENSMKGLVAKVWIVERLGKAPTPAPKKKPTGKYSGTIPTPTIQKGARGAQVKYLQMFLNWYMKQIGRNIVLVVDGSAGDNTIAFLKIFQTNESITADGSYGNKSHAKAKVYKAVDPKPTTTNAEKILAMAKKCAWPYGTAKSKYRYPGGSATADFKKAIAKAYPDRSKWGKQTRAGASCDVFVGTVIRACGVDTKFPRGLDGVLKHMKGNSKWQLTAAKNESAMKPGDVVYQEYKGNGGHIYIYLGGGKIANAHHSGKTYGIVEKFSSAQPASKCRIFNVYRCK